MHVSKGSASRNSTKIWLTKQGGCFLANNNSKIPLRDLRRIMEFIEKNYEDILIEWKKFFSDIYGDSKDLKFYC